MSINSVFMKKEPKDFKIDYYSIIQTIPENSYTEPQLDKYDKIETRWRFLIIPSHILSKNLPNKNKQKIEDKKLVEISRKKPNLNREYLNKNMKWVESTIDPIFDQFVIKEYYYYSDY